MIRISKVHIEKFRGIQKLTLALDGQSFGICGPNGTGKSGVVDAIEFCITGDVTRLSGQGTGDLSVKAHAPHVDHNKNPEKAMVTITATIPSLNKEVTIQRSVQYPGEITISPSDEDIQKVVHELQFHPEFVLSRREIIKYIITPPGKRSEDVQTLLRIEHIEKQRKTLTTFANSQKTAAKIAEGANQQCENELNTALGIETYSPDAILEKINEKRALLALDALEELTGKSSFTSGVPAPSGDQKPEAIQKATTLADLKSMQDAFEDNEPEQLTEDCATAKKILEDLKADQNALAAARRHGFIKTGLELVDGDVCPLCDTQWDADKLREHLQEKILGAEEIEKLLGTLSESAAGVLKELRQRVRTTAHAIQICGKLDPPIDSEALSAYCESLKVMDTDISNFLIDPTDIDTILDAIAQEWWQPEAAVRNSIEACHKSVSDLPDASAEDLAREFLIRVQERHERYLTASQVAIDKSDQNKTARRILEHYENASTSVLEKIYEDVAETFSKYYRYINREDEKDFVGVLKPQPAKLGLDVDFYGRGLFPPGAYHSEGHQDAMGICLYLALMKHTLGSDFTFAVLDDVLMSVDSGHRREVCRLLIKEFPDTQFIATTHDRVWLKFMNTEKLVNRSVTFSGWTVDSGPRTWDDHDVWTEIQDELSAGKVAEAAGILRRYLEYISSILADNLRAEVEYKGNGQYDLGDLLPPVLKAWKKWILEGQECAKTWNNKDGMRDLAAQWAETKELFKKAREEQWAINPSVHFTAWADLQSDEFQEVVDAFEGILESMQCKNERCGSYLYILPSKGLPEELRCNCGATAINLKRSKS